MVVVRPEGTSFLCEALRLHRYRKDLVRKVELVLEQGRGAVERILPIGGDAAEANFLQAAQKCQQGRLADSILAQKTVDTAFLKRCRYAFQDGRLAVAESQIFDFNHILLV